MRISLVIEADTILGFLEQLAELQAIPVGTMPAAKAMAHVAKLAQETEPAKPTKPEKPAKAPAEPDKPTEPETAPAKPEEQEEQPAAAQAPVAAKKRGRRTKAEMQATQAAAAPEAPAKAAPARAGVFTRDDLTAVFREYVTKFGYSAAAADVSKLLQQNLGAGVRKSSDVADDAIPQAIAIVKAAVTENPFSRKVEANG